MEFPPTLFEAEQASSPNPAACHPVVAQGSVVSYAQGIPRSILLRVPANFIDSNTRRERAV